MGRKIYISLGAGKNQLPLIRAARKRRFHVIGVDQDALAPGMELCDYKIIESILNYRKVLYKISTLWYDGDIEGGYCASYGAALASWSYLAEKLSLPAISRPLAEALMDKYEVRKRLADLSGEGGAFRQPGFLAPDSRFNARSRLSMEFPVIIKPRSGWAKANIREASTRSELNRILKLDAPVKKSPDVKKTRGKKKQPPLDILIEERIDGDEITVCGLVQNFKFLLLSITDKITTQKAPFIELEHVFPSKHYHLEERINEAHQAMIERLQVTDTPIVSEWKIRENEIYLVEISLQIPGEFIGSFIIPEAVRYDLFTNLVDMTSGRAIRRKVKKRKFRKARVQYFPSPLPEAEEKEIQKKAIFYQVLNESPSSPPKSNHDRYAVAGFWG